MARRVMDPLGMASDNGGFAAVATVFAIVLLSMLGCFIAWQAGIF